MAKRRDDVDQHLPLGSAEFMILAALHPAQLHGYAISQAVAERTDGKVKLRPGNLYRVLDRLLERRLVEVAERRPPRALDDERRTYYRLTNLGRRVAAAHAELISGVVAQVRLATEES
jgi:DNA-binding PadR family transcriptional regulator